jgi:hypothetical protein
LSYASSPFYSRYFGDMILLFAWASLDHDPPLLWFPLELGWQGHIPLHSAVFCWDWGLANLFFFFCPELAWNWDCPNLSLPCILGWQVHIIVPSH